MFTHLSTSSKRESKGKREGHCCQLAESSAKKLKRRQRKNKMAEEIYGRNLTIFYKKWLKSGRRNFSTNNVTS
jgi:hypothetical protein